VELWWAFWLKDEDYGQQPYVLNQTGSYWSLD